MLEHCRELPKIDVIEAWGAVAIQQWLTLVLGFGMPQRMQHAVPFINFDILEPSMVGSPKQYPAVTGLESMKGCRD